MKVAHQIRNFGNCSSILTNLLNKIVLILRLKESFLWNYEPSSVQYTDVFYLVSNIARFMVKWYVTWGKSNKS